MQKHVSVHMCHHVGALEKDKQWRPFKVKIRYEATQKPKELKATHLLKHGAHSRFGLG